MARKGRLVAENIVAFRGKNKKKKSCRVQCVHDRRKDLLSSMAAATLADMVSQMLALRSDINSLVQEEVLCPESDKEQIRRVESMLDAGISMADSGMRLGDLLIEYRENIAFS